MTKNKITPQMPANPLPHLVDWLVEMGLSEAAGMGVAPLSWRTIDAWCARTGIDLAPWEARLIRSLSSSYVAMGRVAEDETCAPPWRMLVAQQERDSEMARLEMVLG